MPRLGPLITTFCLSLAVVAAASASVSTYVGLSGTAYVWQGREFLYGERHVQRFDDGQIAESVVLYTCRDGSPFARKVVRYRDPFAPDFMLEDQASGYREGVRSEGGLRRVYFAAKSAPEKTTTLPEAKDLVADAGFDEYVRRHWDALLQDRAATFDFLVPSALGHYRFAVGHERSGREQGRPVEVFRLRLAGLWGWLLRGIDVYYDAETHRLLRYEGLSNLRSRHGDNLKTTILYPPDARRTATETDLRAALAAPLAPCHAPG